MREVKRDVDLQRRVGAGLQNRSSLGVPFQGANDPAVRNNVIHPVSSVDRISAA